jgi:hypothetical protein
MPANNTATAPTAPKFDQYVVVQPAGLVVWAKKPPHEYGKASQQTVVVKQGETIKHPEWLGEDVEESAASIERLLAVGAIALKADVDSGVVTIPAVSAVDTEGHLRPVEERPPTVLQMVNLMRKLDGNKGPIEHEKGPGGKRPLVMREIQPFDAPTTGITPELVPAAAQVHQ